MTETYEQVVDRVAHILYQQSVMKVTNENFDKKDLYQLYEIVDKECLKIANTFEKKHEEVDLDVSKRLTYIIENSQIQIPPPLMQ